MATKEEVVEDSNVDANVDVAPTLQHNVAKESRCPQRLNDDANVAYDVAKALRNRERALKELVDTEKTYVDGLGKLVE